MDNFGFQNPYHQTTSFKGNPCIQTMNLQETLYFVHEARNTLSFGQKQFLTPIQINITIKNELEEIMANKKFTEQEMLALRNSKYVLDVSPSIVHFSAEFKKIFWEELSKGTLPREIVKNLGINPNILGDTRINGLKTMIGNEVKKGNGFRDLNTYAQGCNGYLSAENRIKYLEMQLAYKNQEIEFLKKIVSLDPGAQE